MGWFTTTAPATAQKQTKINVAVNAGWTFLQKAMRRGLDTAMLAKFGDKLTLWADRTTELERLRAGLVALERDVLDGPGEWTRLYDSVADMAGFLLRHGDPRRAQVLVAVTDGHDNRGERFTKKPIELGEALLAARRTPGVAPCLPVLIGVGKDIDKAALKAVGEHGQFPVLTTEGFGQLGAVLDQVATQVAVLQSADVVTIGNMRVTVPRPAQLVVERRGIDIALMIDGSASMKEAA